MDTHLDIVAGIVALFAALVWSIRQEGRVNGLEKSDVQHELYLSQLSSRISDLDSQIVKKLTEISQRLSYIEGALHGKINN